jgi:two-component sensor histidine kinase
LKCKREANAASAKEQQDRILQLAIEHEMLHEKYKAKCNGSGSVQQILSDHGQDVERDSYIFEKKTG